MKRKAGPVRLWVRADTEIGLAMDRIASMAEVSVDQVAAVILASVVAHAGDSGLSMAATTNSPKRPQKNPRPRDVVNLDLLSDDALITKRQILAPVYPVSEPTLWRRIATGRFPAAVETGALGLWRVGDVRAWMQSKKPESTPEHP